MNRTKKGLTALALTAFMSISFASVSFAADCTSWSTYSTGGTYCTTDWCNPINPWSGDKKKQVEYQSRVCNLGNGSYEIEYRTLDSTYDCSC